MTTRRNTIVVNSPRSPLKRNLGLLVPQQILFRAANEVKVSQQEEQFFKAVVLNQSHDCYKDRRAGVQSPRNLPPVSKPPLDIAPLDFPSPFLARAIVSVLSAQIQKNSRTFQTLAHGMSYRKASRNYDCCFASKASANRSEEKRLKAVADARIAAMKRKTQQLVENYKAESQQRKEKIGTVLSDAMRSFQDCQDGLRAAKVHSRCQGGKYVLPPRGSTESSNPEGTSGRAQAKTLGPALARDRSRDSSSVQTSQSYPRRGSDARRPAAQSHLAKTVEGVLQLRDRVRFLQEDAVTDELEDLHDRSHGFDTFRSNLKSKYFAAIKGIEGTQGQVECGGFAYRTHDGQPKDYGV